MARRLGYFLAVLLVYAAASGQIAVLWTVRARTENQDNRWSSIVAIADGTAPRPFVKRRLLVDAARLTVRVVPASIFQTVSRAVDRRPGLARYVRDRLGWARRDDPLLFSATALIGLSALGFMLTMRAMIHQLYTAPPLMADACGLALGLALLGGGGDVRFGWFPYDLPNAFVFALTLLAILPRSAWLLPVFALAVSSKETSLLLIAAYVLVHRDRLDRRFVFDLVAMAAVFWGIRHAIDLAYGSGVGGFWFPGRNARLAAWWLAFDAWWYYPIMAVATLRIVRAWPAFPVPLRRLMPLVAVLVTLSVFKGWIEEKRQYLELLPILGPLVLQWVAIELGVGHRLRARSAEPGPGNAPTPDGRLDVVEGG